MKKPHYFDDGNEESVKLPFNDVDEPLEFKLGCPSSLGIYVDSIGCIGGNAQIIGNKWDFEMIKGMDIGVEVVGWVIDETQPAVAASWNVNGLVEIGNELSDLFQIIICWYADDGWEFNSTISDDELGGIGYRQAEGTHGRRQGQG